MSTLKPITPGEINAKKLDTLPSDVVDVFNKLIASNWNGHAATVKQDDVVAALVTEERTREMIFKNHWLDVEDLYRAAGWKVVYDKPAYCETYPATFTFTIKRRRLAWCAS